MPKIRYLKIRFNNRLKPYEVPAFRSAVIEATERRSTLFHNHRPQDGFVYRYPLIQYKITERKASIICLNAATDDIHYLLQNRELDLRIGDRRETYEIEDVQLRYHNVQTWRAGFHYSLRHWMALNQRNYREYEQLQSEVERLQFLENLLCANILSFASGIGWYAEDPVEARITKLKGERWLPYKGTRVRCFSLNFVTNVSLPDYVGLGKGVSMGFGSILQFGRRKSEGGNLPDGPIRSRMGSQGREGEVGSSRKSSARPQREGRREMPAASHRENQSDHTL